MMSYYSNILLYLSIVAMWYFDFDICLQHDVLKSDKCLIKESKKPFEFVFQCKSAEHWWLQSTFSSMRFLLTINGQLSLEFIVDTSICIGLIARCPIAQTIIVSLIQRLWVSMTRRLNHRSWWCVRTGPSRRDKAKVSEGPLPAVKLVSVSYDIALLAKYR